MLADLLIYVYASTIYVQFMVENFAAIAYWLSIDLKY